MMSYTYPEMFAQEQSHFWFLGKQAYLRKVLQHIGKKSANILDMGCGTGGTTQVISNWGNVIGIEKHHTAASFARKRNIKVIEASIHRIPKPNESVDIITILDVLYHKGVNENKALQEAYRLLKPNGYVIIMDCALPQLWSHHDEIMDAKYRYTKNKLQEFVHNAGFRTTHLQYIYGSIFPLILLNRLVLKRHKGKESLPILSPLLNRTLTLLLSIEAALFPVWKPFLGSSILLVAQK